MNALLYAFLFVIALIGNEAFATPADEDKPARVAFAQEFIREMASIEQVRDTYAKEHREDKTFPQQMATMIRTGTRMKLELQANINILEKMVLRPPFDVFITNLQKIYDRKITIQDELISASTQLLSGPKPDVDYDAMAAHAPELTAQDEYLDKIIFETSPAVFLCLVDERADSQGHASHLIITSAQRKQMIGKINTLFGSKLNDKNPTYTTSAAWIIRAGLLKEYKSSDDPW